MLGETACFLRRYVLQHSWVSGFHVHRLRDTFACRWLERGGSKEVLQELLGHSSMLVTEKYGRLNPASVAAEVAKITQHGTLSGTVNLPDAVSTGSATGNRTRV